MAALILYRQVSGTAEALKIIDYLKELSASNYIGAIAAAFIYTPLALLMIALPATMYFLPERGSRNSSTKFWPFFAALAGRAVAFATAGSNFYFLILTLKLAHRPRLLAAALAALPSMSQIPLLHSPS